MEKNEYLSIAQVAKILGISRIAVYKKVKKGEIKAIRIGRSFAIPKAYVEKILGEVKGRSLTEEEKKEIEKVVKRAVKEYGETLRLLGAE